MKKWKTGFAVMAAVLLLTGCGKGSFSPGEDGIYVRKDGTVTAVLVEEMDKEYYSADDLEEFAKGVVETYNEEHDKDSVKVTSCKKKKDTVTLTMEYKSADVYEDFNSEQLFCGTVEEALKQENGLDAEFISFKNEKETNKDVVMEHKDYKVVATNESQIIQVDGKIIYMSSNVEKTGRKQVKVSFTEENEMAYIIYK